MAKKKQLCLYLVLILAVFSILIVKLTSAQPTTNPTLTLEAAEVTDRTVTLSWTRDQGLSFNGRPFFNDYELRMSTMSLNSSYPYTRSNYEDVFVTTDNSQTTTTVANLSSSTTYYFYILASDYYGGAFSNIVEVQTLPNPNSLTATPSPSSSPSVPEFSWLTILPLLLAIPIVLIIFRKRVASRNSSN